MLPLPCSASAHRRPCLWLAVTLASIGLGWSDAAATHVVEVPVLAAVTANQRGAFEVLVMSWDEAVTPAPLEVRWANARIRIKGQAADALSAALRYAVDHSAALHPTGTVSIYGASYVPVSTDGPSAGAAMAVGFMAVLRGHQIVRGVALTGTLQPDGSIGPVGAIPDKVRAAVREGYRTILVPEGQLTDPQWNLPGLAMELRVTVKEVGTITTAYELMTGQRP